MFVHTCVSQRRQGPPRARAETEEPTLAFKVVRKSERVRAHTPYPADAALRSPHNVDNMRSWEAVQARCASGPRPSVDGRPHRTQIARPGPAAPPRATPATAPPRASGGLTDPQKQSASAREPCGRPCSAAHTCVSRTNGIGQRWRPGRPDANARVARKSSTRDAGQGPRNYVTPGKARAPQARPTTSGSRGRPPPGGRNHERSTALGNGT